MRSKKTEALTIVTDKKLREKVIEYAKKIGVKPENDIYEFIQKAKRKISI